MLRKLMGAAVLLVLCVGVSFADEIRAVITKIDGNNVTFAEMKGKEKGDAKTLPVSDSLKVVKGKFNKDTKKMESGEPVDGGLKNEALAKISDKGVRATIVTDEDGKKITEIRLSPARTKKKDN